MKRQRRIKTEKTDRFMLTTDKEMGEKIRKLADVKGLTISHFLATIVEPEVERLIEEQNGEE